MTSQIIVIIVFFFVVFYELNSIKKSLRKLEFSLRNKIDKPPEENPMEKFKREREERIARLEKEENS